MDVLVYLDPSPRGEWALAAAAQLPPRWRGTLRLLDHRALRGSRPRQGLDRGALREARTRPLHERRVGRGVLGGGDETQGSLPPRGQLGGDGERPLPPGRRVEVDEHVHGVLLRTG